MSSARSFFSKSDVVLSRAGQSTDPADFFHKLEML